MKSLQLRHPAVLGLVIRAGLILCLLPLLGLTRSHSTGTHHKGDILEGDMHIAPDETREGDLVSSGSIDIEGTLKGDCVVRGGSVKVSGKVLGDLIHLGGSGGITGEIDGDVTSLGGVLTITGKVKGDVTVAGGEVTLGPSAQIGGDLTHMGGVLSQAEGASIKGKITQLNLGSLGSLLALAMKYGKNTDLSDSSFSHSSSPWAFLVFIGAVGIVVLLLAALLPSPSGNIAEAVRSDFWKSAGIGLLIYLCLFPAFLFLCISIIGILFIPLVFLLFCAAEFLSLLAFSQVLAGRFYESLKKNPPSNLVAAAVGYLLLNLLWVLGALLQPAGSLGAVVGGIFLFSGFMLVSCGLMVGLGAVWSTRMGSRGRPGAPLPAETLPQ